MSDDPVHHPHDKLFRTSFGDPANAAGFLRHELPEAVSRRIDWERLRLEPGSFVDSHYRHSESDLLFSAPLGESDCFLYILFEHQSTQDPAIALRLLRYMVRIWERMLEEGSKKLAPILPVVLAQNAEVWRMPTCFSALFAIPEGLERDLRAFIPDFLFRLVQLAELPFDAVRGAPFGIMALRAMKADRLRDFLNDAVWDEALLVQLTQKELDLLLRYILQGDVDKEAFERRMRVVTDSRIKRTAMSLAEQLRQEGRQEGIQRSILEALEVRFGTVPDGLREAVEEVLDETRLLELHKASIRADSLEDFARAL